METAKIKKYEAYLVKNFDLYPGSDRTRIEIYWQTRVAIQLKFRMHMSEFVLFPSQQIRLPYNQLTEYPQSHNIVTLGTLHYPPNADGIRWFIKEVLPLIRLKISDVTLTVIGKNPPADFLKLKDDSDGAIDITGYVQDLRPYLNKAALMVVPVRAGSGMRVRILEAFAWGIPVITTTIGLEGIAAQKGDDVLVADDAGDFANEAVRLLGDEELQSNLAKNGRDLVTKLYDWRVVLKKLDEIYHAI